MPTNRNRSGLLTESSSLFPDNITQEISPADLRSWIADGTTSFVTQKDKSTLENAIYEARSSSLASAATTDLSTASGNYVHITGTTTITSFGTCSPGSRFVLVFDGVLTLTYNATSLIIPGSANKTTAAGDACMIISEGSGNWKIVGYFAISGGGGGGGITALTGDVTASGTGSVAATIAVDAVDIPMLSATGTPDSTTFLRGDNTWAIPSGATPTGYHGAFQDNTTQTAISANTAYPVKFNTTELSNGVTIVNDGSGNPTRITLANTGIYNLQFSLQLEKTGGSSNFIIDIWVRKNGVDIPDTTGKVVLTGSASASPVVAAWNYLLDLAGGDYVQLMWSTSNNNAVILAAAATPPHPSVPSSILTITQQAGIMAGTGITGMVGTTGTTQTGATQTFSSSEMTIASAANTHTFTIPDASASTKGLITTGAQTLAGIKTFGNGTSAGEIRLLEGGGSNFVGIKSPASLAADYSLTLPADDGGSGQVLLTDGSGVLSWANAGPIGSKYISTTSVNTLAAGSAFTVFVSLEIPANTFGNGSIFRILQRTLRPTSGTAATIRLGFNTAISTSGANMVWLSSAASTINAGAFTGTTQRHISIEGTTTSYYLAGWGSASNDDVIFAYNPAQTAAIDWTVTQYLIIGASTGASDTMQNIFTSITPLS
jgi:hypothetical protein